MKEIKKINSMSLAKITGLFGLVFGLIVDIVISLGITFTGQSSELISGPMLVFLPIVYGALYFIAGLLFSVIYNLLSKHVGGIKLGI